MALEVTKGQICDGSISKNIYHEEHNLCGKFHNCITKCTKGHFLVLCHSTIWLFGESEHHYCIVGTTKVCVVYEKKSPKNQPHFFPDDEAGKTKPKQAFRSTQNAFNKLLWI